VKGFEIVSRSVRIHEFGDAGVLPIEDVAVGEPKSGEVRLRIQAIGLNRTEITLPSGRSPMKPIPISSGASRPARRSPRWTGKPSTDRDPRAIRTIRLSRRRTP